MAKFKQNNVELRDNQKIIFDSAKNKYMSYNGSELFVNTNVSGVEPTEDYHLGTKEYIDSSITTATGSLTTNHSDLNELDYASSGHTGFASTTYVDAADVVLDNKIDTTSGTLQDNIDNIPVPVFGSEYDYGSSDAESSTTADTPQQKLRFTTASLPSGTYHIEWGYEFMADDNKNSDFNAQVQINDTTTIAEQGDNAAWKLDTIWAAQSGFYDAALSGVLNIDIDYWDSAAIGVSIRRARAVIWRTI